MIIPQPDPTQIPFFEHAWLEPGPAMEAYHICQCPRGGSITLGGWKDRHFWWSDILVDEDGFLVENRQKISQTCSSAGSVDYIELGGGLRAVPEIVIFGISIKLHRNSNRMINTFSFMCCSTEPRKLLEAKSSREL